MPDKGSGRWRTFTDENGHRWLLRGIGEGKQVSLLRWCIYRLAGR